MLRICLAFGFVLLAMARPLCAQVPLGAEFQVTPPQPMDTSYASAAVDAAGRFVVVWFRQSPGNEIRGQRFDRDGVKVGADFKVSSWSYTFASRPGIAMAGDGEFVVVWEESYGSPDRDIHGRRFDRLGSPIGVEFKVNAYTTGNQWFPNVAMDAGKNIVVAWTDELQDGLPLNHGVFARRFDAANLPLSPEFRVPTTATSGEDSGSTVAVAPNGEFVIAWWSNTPGLKARARLFDAAATPRGPDFSVGVDPSAPSWNPAPAYAPDGTILFVFDVPDVGGGPFEHDIFARRVSATGAPMGGQFRVSTYTTGRQLYPKVAMDGGGNYVVQWWESEPGGGDGSATAVKARFFGANDTPRTGEFVVNTYTTGNQYANRFGTGVACAPSGDCVVSWASLQSAGRHVFAQQYGPELAAESLVVDSGANGVLEPGESVDVKPGWRNRATVPWSFTGSLSNLTGPPGATYAITDATASYGVVAPNSTGACVDCYAVSVSNPTIRPAVHWDATVTELLTPSAEKQWRLHVGRSFDDVPAASPFYRFIETLLHASVTGGCSATAYCPAASAAREQMAVFVLVAREGADYVPRACTTPVFGDVPAASPFCRWIEELARRGVVGGCGGGNYCPSDPVTREQMAVFVLRTLDPVATPPPCTIPVYGDVPASSPFCPWIEELTRRNVVGGCGGGNYCPFAAVTREQMGVFISVSFGLALYGP